jgi:superfamily II DNA or RNA helicase
MKANNWFISRGLRVLNYQADVLQKIDKSMVTEDVTILAACPSAGKTIMAIYCIEDFLKKHKDSRVVVLTHGTTVLRTQFHDVLEEVKPDFQYKLVEKFSEFDSNADVNVCLPQTLNNNILSKIDLLVVDEAHQFYFADMVQDIITQTKPQRQLLLTGTPSIFIQKGFKIIPIPLMVIVDEGMASDLRIEIATSSYDFDIIRDYNEDRELKTEVEIRENDTKKTLDELLGKIISKLSNNHNIRTWSQTLSQLTKTMFACRSQKQAIQVKQYFDAIGIKSALSISDIDTDSQEIQRFKDQQDCLVLIVVGRGILGFSYTRLVNIVDLSTSQNIDRIYQLLCRVVRKHPDGLQKLFFKVAPKNRGDYYKYVMSAVLALTSEEFFTKFNGKNFDELQIPVKHTGNRGKGKDIFNYKKKVKAEVRDYEPLDFTDLPVFEFFKDVYSSDPTLNTYTLTTIKDVRAEFLERKPRGFWSLEKCQKSASRFTVPLEWKIGDFDAYSASKYYNWYQDCVKHMTTNHRILEICQRISSRYSSTNEWKSKERESYDMAVKYGVLELC